MNKQDLVSHDAPAGGRIASICPATRGLPGRLPKLRSFVRRYLASVASESELFLFQEDPRVSDSGDLESSVWGLLSCGHVEGGAIPRAMAARFEGLTEPYYNPERQTFEDFRTPEPVGVGTWHIHQDGVCRLGLRICGVPAPSDFRADRISLFDWAVPLQSNFAAYADSIWQKNPRSALKEIFQYLGLYCQTANIHSIHEFDAHALEVLSFLEDRRDPDTGFIGGGSGVPVGSAMRGYRNFVINFSWLMGVRETAPEKVIDSTLSCLRPDGMFDDGGMCANMDAIELLVEYGLRTGYRIDEIRRCAEGTVAAIHQNLLVDGSAFAFDFEDIHRTGKRDCRWLTNGMAFVMQTLRFWQALPGPHQEDLDAALLELGWEISG